MIEIITARIEGRLQDLWNSCQEGLAHSQGRQGWDSSDIEAEGGWLAMQEDIEEIAKLTIGKKEFEYTGDILPKENV